MYVKDHRRSPCNSKNICGPYPYIYRVYRRRPIYIFRITWGAPTIGSHADPKKTFYRVGKFRNDPPLGDTYLDKIL